MPATVQSAIAYTSIARGNVAAAICSASASSLLGVFISPLLVAWLLHQHGQLAMWQTIEQIIWQLFVPFIAGHLLRPLLINGLMRHKRVINITDRSSILLVVYGAFSEAVTQGIWQKIHMINLVLIMLTALLLLVIVLLINTALARHWRFSVEDEITIVFCGSKKSLTNGVAMANILFPLASVGIILLPLMLFHQIQLMVCAQLAHRYAQRPTGSVQVE